MPIDSSQREPVKNCVRVSIFVLGLVALPLHVSAQSGEAEAPTDGGELAVSSIPEDAESSVSSESVGQDPNWAPRDRVRRARAGVIVSCVAIGAGGGLLAGAFLYVGDDSGGFDDWNLGPNIAMASNNGRLCARDYWISSTVEQRNPIASIASPERMSAPEASCPAGQSVCSKDPPPPPAVMASKSVKPPNTSV